MTLAIFEVRVSDTRARARARECVRAYVYARAPPARLRRDERGGVYVLAVGTGSRESVRSRARNPIRPAGRPAGAL